MSLLSCAGCAFKGQTQRERIAAAARPLLTLDSDVVWSDCFNRLADEGAASITYLMEQPAMAQPVAPDNLATMVHCSLVRLLASAYREPPPLTARCLETTLGVLHFDVKVLGQPVGPVVWAEERLPIRWHDLYPAEFNHVLAGAVDVEADRKLLRAWWRVEREGGDATLVTARRLRPASDDLWHLLSRRYADLWTYLPEPRAVRVADEPAEAALLRIATEDYNLVRAACLWLGTNGADGVTERLIDMVGSVLPVEAHNARFALAYHPDPRIRAVIEVYRERGPRERGPGEGARTVMRAR